MARNSGGNVSSAISSLIVAAEQGDGQAAETLFAALYAELHRLAKRQLTWFRREQNVIWLEGFGDDPKIINGPCIVEDQGRARGDEGV